MSRALLKDMYEDYVALSDEDSEDDTHGFTHRQPPELQVSYRGVLGVFVIYYMVALLLLYLFVLC